MKTLLGNFTVGIAIAIISSFITLLIRTNSDKNESRMRYLDVKPEIRNDIIGKPVDLDKKIEVFLDGEKIKNLSQVNFSVYNATDKDYEDVPIFIEIRPRQGDSLKLVSEKVSGVDNLPDGISQMRDVVPSRKGAVKFAYKAQALNRIGEKPVFSASYLLIGNVDSTYINVIKANLDLINYDYWHFHPPSFIDKVFDNFFIAIIVILSAYLVLVFVVIRIVNFFSRKSEIKADQKLKEYIEQKLKVKFSKENINVEPTTLAETYIKIANRYSWEKESKFSKFFNGKKEPENYE